LIFDAAGVEGVASSFFVDLLPPQPTTSNTAAMQPAITLNERISASLEIDAVPEYRTHAKSPQRSSKHLPDLAYPHCGMAKLISEQARLSAH
jgi:hypothetical protein